MFLPIKYSTIYLWCQFINQVVIVISKILLTQSPDLKNRISIYSNVDSNFKEVCENYEEAFRMLQILKKQPDNKVRLIKEYEILVKELEDELLAKLRKYTNIDKNYQLNI